MRQFAFARSWLPASALPRAGWLVTSAVAIAHALPNLFRPGMFFDGVIYATVARNLSVGIGGAWHLVFAASGWGSDFHEAPPLAFVLESYFFRLFGDHFWVEKLYSLLTGLATAIVIVAIWRRLTAGHRTLRECAWLPVLFWVVLPSWMPVYGNNLLEGTMGLFATGAVYALLRAAGGGRSVVWLPVGAACIAAAFFSKGPVGLFPLVTPIIAGITLGWSPGQRSIARAIGANAVLVALTVSIVFLVLRQPGAADGFMQYLHVQVFASLAGARDATHSSLGRLYIIRELIRELFVVTIAAAALVYWARRRGVAQSEQTSGLGRGIAFCLLMGLCASLPIMLSPKQFNWYLFPSYAFYVLAITLWCGPALVHLLARGNEAKYRCGLSLSAWASAIAASILAAGLVAAVVHPPRELDVYHDTLELARLLPKGTAISFLGRTQEIHRDSAIGFYMVRWGYLAPDREAGHEYLLLSTNANSQPPSNYHEIPSELRLYRLYQRSNEVPLTANSAAGRGKYY